MCWLWLTWTYSAVFWLLTLNPKWATNLYFQLYKWLNNFIKQLGTLALVGTIFRCALTHIWAVCKLLEQINISLSAALMCLKAFVETVSSFPTTEKITCREVKFAYRFLCVSVGVPLILGPLWWKNDNFCEACCSNFGNDWKKTKKTITTLIQFNISSSTAFRWVLNLFIYFIFS